MSRTRPPRTPAPLAPAKTTARAAKKAARPATSPAKAAARYAAPTPTRVSARPGADAAKPRSAAAKPAVRSVTATPAKPAARAAVTSAKAAARSAAATPAKAAARSTVASPKAEPRAAAAPAQAFPRAAAGKNGNAHASLSREDIADHIAAFRKRGGRIEVLGTTPLRTTAPAAFRSRSTVQRQAQTRASGKAGS